MQNCSDLIEIFNGLFLVSERTELVKGGDEPLYKPCVAPAELNQIIFTADYFSSALHEIAHWCVAGAARRKQLDFGYWYNPDGRTVEQQRKFEQAEVKPQALEWIFSKSAQRKFQVSADNLQNNLGASNDFRRAICSQVSVYLQQGLPLRAGLFSEALIDFYKTSPFNSQHFQLTDI